MADYIDPPSQTKEEYLTNNGSIIKLPAQLDDISRSESDSLVCLVDNGLFTAAAIVRDEVDMKAFSDPSDSRPKVWFTVTTKRLVDDGHIKDPSDFYTDSNKGGACG